jgi:hypothetical protein
MTELIDKARKLTTADRFQIAGDVETWRQVYTAPNLNGWFTGAGDGRHGGTVHVTQVAKVRCRDLVEGCVQAQHCQRCGECLHRGGPYGCHCECSRYNACEWCEEEQ